MSSTKYVVMLFMYVDLLVFKIQSKDVKKSKNFACKNEVAIENESYCVKRVAYRKLKIRLSATADLSQGIVS